MDIKYMGLSFAGIEAAGVQKSTNDDKTEKKVVYRIKFMNIPLFGWTDKTQKGKENAHVAGELDPS